MRICHIFENFSPFTMGGVERQIQLISNFLSNTDPNLKFSLITDRNCLVPSLHPNLSKFQNYGNLRVFRLGPNPAKFAKAFLDRSQKIFVKKEIRKINIIQKNLEFQLFLEASKIDDVRNADIFHLHGMWDTVYDSLALELSKYFGKPLIVHLRGTYILGAEAMPCPAKEGRAILEHASAIITHNSNVFRKLENWKLEKKAHIIPNGIDIQEFQFKARDMEKKSVEIAFVGRLSAIRDPITAIRAFSLLLKKIPYAKLHIVGSGELEMDIAQLIQDLGIEKSAILHGSQSNVNGFLRKSDVFWATSQVTNWPSNSLMEALASGLPVVATNTGLTNELIVDKINGLLVLPSNAEEIVVSTERILKEGALRRKLAINARATAENNDVKKIYPKIAHLYYSILNQ